MLRIAHTRHRVVPTGKCGYGGPDPERNSPGGRPGVSDRGRAGTTHRERDDVTYSLSQNLLGVAGIGLAVGFFGYVLILIVATLRTSGPIGLVDQQTKKNPLMDG